MKQRNDLAFYDATAQEWWNQSAKIYALNHLNPPRFEYFDRFLTNWENLTVLDVGCGGGFTCEFLAHRGAIVHGIDQSVHCIAIGQEHAVANHLKIMYKQGYSERLPYADETFDVVICVDVLEHVEDLKKTLLEISRVLKPGGFFLFDTINRTFKSNLIMIWLLEELLQEISRGIHDWQKFIKPEELFDSLQVLNFQEIDIQGFNIFGATVLENVAAYFHYRKTGKFRININQDLSVMYIGKAQKLSLTNDS